MKQQVGPILSEGLCTGNKEEKKVDLVPEFKVKWVIRSWRKQSSKAGVHPVVLLWRQKRHVEGL